MNLHRYALLLAAATLAVAACEGAPTGAGARGAAPLLNESHPCSPSLSGPGSLAVGAQGTYTLSYYNSGSLCSNPSVSWSVSNGAQIVWTESPTLALNGAPVAGRARVQAGQCDFTVTANVTFNGASAATQTLSVLVRDCTPLSVTLSPGSSPYGAINVGWNAVRADSFRVYRRVVPRSGSPDSGFLYRGTRTGTSFTDIGYRISNRFDYEFNLWYRVDAYQGGTLLSTHTAYTWAEDNADVD